LRGLLPEGKTERGPLAVFIDAQEANSFAWMLIETRLGEEGKEHLLSPARKGKREKEERRRAYAAP